MVVAQAPGEDAGGFGVGGPFVHSFGVGQGSKPFEQCDEAFTFAQSYANILCGAPMNSSQAEK